MIFTSFRSDLPDWVKGHIMLTCPHCNSYIVDNSDEGRGTTARWCPNKTCPGHMSYKMDEMAKILDIKGFGPKTAESLIKANGWKSHLDILPYWLNGKKPVMRLSKIAALACIDGYGITTGEVTLDHFSSFAEYFKSGRNVDMNLWDNRDVLFELEKYFTPDVPLSSRQIKVMGHGSFHGFNNRQEFFNEVNAAFGNFVHVIETGVRKTGISYLLLENDTPREGRKWRAACEAGVSVVTPAEFVNILNKYVHN